MTTRCSIPGSLGCASGPATAPGMATSAETISTCAGRPSTADAARINDGERRKTSARVLAAVESNHTHQSERDNCDHGKDGAHQMEPPSRTGRGRDYYDRSARSLSAKSLLVGGHRRCRRLARGYEARCDALLKTLVRFQVLAVRQVCSIAPQCCRIAGRVLQLSRQCQAHLPAARPHQLPQWH